MQHSTQSCTQSRNRVMISYQGISGHAIWTVLRLELLKQNIITLELSYIAIQFSVHSLEK